MKSIKELAESIEKYFEEAEESAIEIIEERLEKIEEADSDDITGLMKLQDISGDLQSMRKKIANTVDKAEEEIYNIVEECAREYYEEAAENCEGEIEPFEKNTEVLWLVEKVKRECCEELEKALQMETLGVENEDGDFEQFEQWYRDTVNEAVTMAAKEDDDLEEFVEEAIECLEKRGLVKNEI